MVRRTFKSAFPRDRLGPCSASSAPTAASPSKSDLPRRANIHYLGSKEYRALPSYLAGWDVGLLPFALNESTRFISPTKTPEYLAAGIPVVSTPITDVVEPYGTKQLVEIAETGEQFAEGIARAMSVRSSSDRLARVDRFLSRMSWDLTWEQMQRLIQAAVHSNLDIQDSAGLGGTMAAD